MPPSTGSGTGTAASGVISAQEAAALSYFSAVWVWDNSAGAYINNTIESQIPSGTAFSIFQDTADYLYLGSSRRFDLAVFLLAVVGGGLGTITWEYYAASGWTRVIPGNSYDFSVSGGETFDRLTSWATLGFSAGTPHAPAPPDTTVRYWVRVRTSSVTTAPTVNEIQMRQYAVYCTPTDVANLLQVPDFTTTTTPTRNAVEDAIHAAQAFIDQRTHKSWRLGLAVNEEHEFNIAGFKLIHTDVRDIMQLQVWDGGTYETKTQGRQNDYFVVPQLGMVYFSRYFLLPARLQSYNAPVWLWGWAEFTYPIRVTYSYGREVPVDEREGGIVFDATRKKVAIDIWNTHDYGILSVSGGQMVSLPQKIVNWERDIEGELDSITAWVTW